MGFGTNQDPNTAKTRGPRKEGQATIMRNPHDRAIQAHQMMVDKIDGRMTLPQIARKYDCTPDTANRQLQFARNHGLYLDRARQLIEVELLPRALSVYEKYLDGDGDDEKSAHALDAARDILFGLGALSKSTTVKHTPSDVADTLDSWREKYFEETTLTANAVTVTPVPSLPAAECEDDEGEKAANADRPRNNDAEDDGA